MAIDGLPPIQIHWPRESTGRIGDTNAGARVTEDFGKALSNALSEVRANEQTAEHMAKRFATGDQTIGIHEVMIAAEKASISLRYAVTLKNKLIEAYRDLMNTPV